MNLLFACGGTAGHVNPAVALARVFQARTPGCKILFVGADGGMETRLVPKEGYEIRTVTISGFYRSPNMNSLKHNLKALRELNTSRAQAARILDDFRPDLVVGTGGYASYPVVKEAARRGIPTAVHESNAVPGLTTRALSKAVDCVMVGFQESARYYAHPEKVVVTGTPVRGDFFRYSREEARTRLGLTDDRPLLLSYWGSLGAEVMNNCMLDFFREEANADFPFHHIHGAGRDYEKMLAALGERGLCLASTGVEVREYIYDMPLIMAAADLVLCRAGASTISEISALEKPAILVPSPNVTADHQMKNARVLADAGGAVLIPEAECTGEKLYQRSAELLSSEKKRDVMSNVLRGLGTTDANEKIYLTLLGLLKR